ncbi:hypothetical protein V8F33_014195 [Rhypophila sp. PSN 637]
MSFNRIVAKKIFTRVSTPAGKDLVLSAATRTTNWYRPEGTEQSLKEPLEKAVTKAEKENPSLIPANTAELVLRYANMLRQRLAEDSMVREKRWTFLTDDT